MIRFQAARLHALLFALLATPLAFGQTTSLATQGAYLRKSITTLDSVWIQTEAIDGRVPFELDTLEQLVRFYVHIPRFDYTELEPSLTDEFRRQANALPDINAGALAQVIQRTLAVDLLVVLNDPEVQAVRRDGLLSEADLQRFASVKARSLGLTDSQLTLLFNSSYFYLPYLAAVTLVQDRDDNAFRASVSGGILWYRLRVDANTGATSVDLLAAEATAGVALGDPEQQLHKLFVFGDEVRSVTAPQYALLNATQAFARNLGTLTKALDDFQLTAQVVEATGRTYGFLLGNREGVRLDDGFHLVEVIEDAAGLSQRRVGYVRVVEPADNGNDPAALTRAVQMLGRQQPVGTTLVENPVSGVDLRLRPQLRGGFAIPVALTTVPGLSGSVLAEPATRSIGVGAVLSYNLAPLVGISQLFLNADAAASILLAQTAPGAAFTPYLLESYLSATKKFWLGPLNAQVTAGIGVDWLELNGQLLGADISWSRRELGVKAELDVEYMLTPNVHLHAGAGYRLDLLPIGSRLEIDGVGTSFSAPGNAAMNLGGWSVRAGINLQLQELPFNVFGFLDAIPGLFPS